MRSDPDLIINAKWNNFKPANESNRYNAVRLILVQERTKIGHDELIFKLIVQAGVT